MPANRYILGISCYYHDSAAVLIQDGDLIAAAQEERFSRIKFDRSFPTQAINWCLKYAGIDEGDITCVAFYEDPIVKLDRIIASYLRYRPWRILSNTKSIYGWIQRKCFVEDLIWHNLPGFKGDIFFSQHHLSHAASAYYPSPFSEAAILTVDAMGEWSCTSIGYGKGSNLKILKEQRYPHSLGLLYSAMTQYLGFKINSGEYKVMGLAPYGSPKYVDLIKQHLIDIHPDGVIQLHDQYFNLLSQERLITDDWSKIFDQPIRSSESEIQPFHADMAKSIQVVTEEAVLNMANQAVQLTGCKNLVMAGGVALNCVANGKIYRSGLIDNMWIQPASGDAGGALGAALAAYYYLFPEVDKLSQQESQKGSFLGPKFPLEDIRYVLDAYQFAYTVYSLEDLYSKIVELLSQSLVIGLFQGQMEYGPRALGSRSIIGDPRDPNMQKRMNLKIKFRESFRPFAPMVLDEYAGEWFEKPDDWPYMLFTTQITQSKQYEVDTTAASGMAQLHQKRSPIPAITHVDYSARLQTIDAKRNPFIYQLLKNWHAKTQCPVLINTSFNIRGEPIVCTPLDALRCFMNTDMDCLVLENTLLLKQDQSHQLKEQNYQQTYELD
ncbi:MAG: carbamoyltransferase [Cyanobacteria bacterium P01_A01_bin.123]